MASTIDRIIAKVESGEPIDWAQEARLADLRVAKIAEEFAEEAVRRDKLADDAMFAYILGDEELSRALVRKLITGSDQDGGTTPHD